MSTGAFTIFAAVVIVVILVMLIGVIIRFRKMQETNARIEENQRQSLEIQRKQAEEAEKAQRLTLALAERQTDAMERIAAALDKREG